MSIVRSFALRATICAVIFLALAISAASYGSGPWPFPPDDEGGNIALHVTSGPWPFPPDDEGGNIALGVRSGPWPFPPDDEGGNLRLV
jgi:hypothetical protein